MSGASNPANDIKNLPPGLVAGMYEAFKLGDSDANFELNVAELYSKMEGIGVNLGSPQEFEDLQYGADVDCDPKIGFAEFLGTLAPLKGDNKEDVAKVLSIFDLDGNKEISKNNIQAVLGAFGMELTREEMKALFTEADKNQDGSLNIKEFLEVIAFADQNLRKNGVPPGMQ